jgi:hypothetical protein
LLRFSRSTKKRENKTARYEDGAKQRHVGSPQKAGASSEAGTEPH